MTLISSGGFVLPISGGSVSPGLAEVTMQSSITYDGVTLTFSEAVPTCELAGGRPAILTHLGDVVITNDTPTAEDVGGYFANGAMWNPYLEFNPPSSGGEPQGFDNLVTTVPNRGGNTVFNVSACVSPSYSGNGNLTVDQGTTGTFVKSVRRDPATNYRMIEKFVPFTFLDAVPAANAVRPGMSGLTKTCDVTLEDFDYTVFQNITKPASVRSLSEALGYLPEVFPMFGWAGDCLRLFHNYDPLVTNDGYAGEYGIYHAELFSALHFSGSDSEKQSAVLRMVEWARDMMGLYERGWRGGFGAGQHHGIHEALFIGAFVTGDAAMLSAAYDIQSNIYAATWFKEDVKNYPIPQPQDPFFDGIGNVPWCRPILEEDVGKPHYTGDGQGASLWRRYLGTAGPAMFSGITSMLGLKNGPGGITGAQALAHSGSLGPENSWSAPAAYVDRYRTWQPWPYIVGNTSAWMRDYYDAVRPLVADPIFTCIPDTYEGPVFSVGSGDGEIDWDLSTVDHGGNLSKTDTWIRYGIDKVSFVEANGNGATGTLTGLNRGVLHYCQHAFENSAGRGVFSPNYPLEWIRATDLDTGERNVVTPTGTVANAAPSWAGRLAPALYSARSEGWGENYHDLVDTGSVLPETVTKLTAGVGYPSGYPAPTVDDFTYQWQRNGSDISGATGKDYHLINADLGQDIRCAVTVTTVQGTASMNTDAVTVYGYPTLAAGVLWETDCGPSMSVRYPGIMDSAYSEYPDNHTENVGAIVHVPTEALKDQVPTADIGTIYCKKIGGRCTASFKIGPMTDGVAQDVISGTTYKVTFSVLRNVRSNAKIGASSSEWLAGIEFCVGSLAQRWSDNFVETSVISTNGGTPDRINVEGTFTPGATGPAYATFCTTFPTGGVGGEVLIDGIKFEEV